jgi:tetratricopeptide (TPR) repeat protein
LQINPNFALAHYNLSKVLFQKGEVEEATTHYRRAVQINPDFATAPKVQPSPTGTDLPTTNPR